MVLLVAAVLFVLAVEGVVCLAMAAPLGIPLAAMGGAAGYAIRRGASPAAPRAAGMAVIALPVLIGAEALAPAAAPLYSTRTDVVVDAPPDVVWRHVVAFSEIPPPAEWVFQRGIAYPLRSRIEGAGVGAIRRCEFTTGAFVEPITAWEPGRRLAFDVVAQPPPMVEWTLWDDVHPAHLRGYFESERGEFRLTSLPGGRTRLEGTTWYRHRVAPSAYWRWWSDAILHQIHGRVLRHVGRTAEADPRTKLGGL